MESIFVAAKKQFLVRNRKVLPQMQLQTGAGERWFASEFAMALNRVRSGTWSPTTMTQYVDCEYLYGDISEWKCGVPTVLYEVKVLYSYMSRALIRGIIHKAELQLASTRFRSVRKVALFFVVYIGKGPSSEASQKTIDEFKRNVSEAIAEWFDNGEQDLSQLSSRAQIEYGSKDNVWHTESWVSCRSPKPAKRVKAPR